MTEQAAGFRSLEFQREIEAGDRNLGVVTLQILLKP